MYNMFKKSTANIREPVSRGVFVVVNYVFLAVAAVITLIPMINLLAMSFSDSIAVTANEVKLWPIGFTFVSYEHIISNTQFISSLLITIYRTALGIALNLLITVLAAYPLSKPDQQFRARKYYVWAFIFTMVFNGGLIPLYMIVRYTHIYDTIMALLFPGAINVFYILILLNFFRSLPKEIEESAFVDGAGHFTVLSKIYLPLSKAALATLVLFFFVGHWNSWFDGLIYMSTPKHYPLQTYLQLILSIPDVTKMSPEQLEAFGRINLRSIKTAEIFITTIPILLVYPFLQKYFTKGIILGSVKG